MGRKRKDDPHGLAGTRLYWRHGQFHYVHRDGRWEGVGADVAIAKAKAARHNEGAGEYGTVRYWFGEFVTACEARVEAGLMAQRTLDDYLGYLGLLPPTKRRKAATEPTPLIVFFGDMIPEEITPQPSREVRAVLLPGEDPPQHRRRS